MSLKIMFSVLLAVFIGSNVIVGLPVTKEGSNIAGPVDDVEGVVKGMKGGLNAIKGVTKKANAGTKLIKSLMNKSEHKLIGMISGLGKSNAKEVNVLKDGIMEYQGVKLSLEKTRRELKSLAHRTVVACDDILLFMEGWEDDNSKYRKEYVLVQLETMKEILEESKDILNAADAAYNDALEKMQKVDFDLEAFALGIQATLEEAEAKYDAGTAGTREEKYLGSFQKLVGSATENGLKCTEKCGVADWASTFTTLFETLVTIGMTESSIAKQKTTFKELEKNTEKTVKTIKETRGEIGHLEVLINEEIRIIKKWVVAVDQMNKWVKKAEDDRFYRLHLFRKALVKATTDLKKVAKDFTEQPDKIPGQLGDSALEL